MRSLVNLGCDLDASAYTRGDGSRVVRRRVHPNTHFLANNQFFACFRMQRDQFEQFAELVLPNTPVVQCEQRTAADKIEALMLYLLVTTRPRSQLDVDIMTLRRQPEVSLIAGAVRQLLFDAYRDRVVLWPGIFDVNRLRVYRAAVIAKMRAQGDGTWRARALARRPRVRAAPRGNIFTNFFVAQRRLCRCIRETTRRLGAGVLYGRAGARD